VNHCLSSRQHRPHHRPTVGPRVSLTRFWRRRGPLQPGQEGVLVRDAHDYQPYYVLAANGGDGAISKMRSPTSCGRETNCVAIRDCAPSTVKPSRSSNSWPEGMFNIILEQVQPGQKGVLVRDAHDHQPYYGRASNESRWCYFQNEIMPCPGVESQIVWQHETVPHRRSSCWM